MGSKEDSARRCASRNGARVEGKGQDYRNRATRRAGIIRDRVTRQPCTSVRVPPHRGLVPRSPTVVTYYRNRLVLRSEGTFSAGNDTPHLYNGNFILSVYIRNLCTFAAVKQACMNQRLTYSIPTSVHRPRPRQAIPVYRKLPRPIPANRPVQPLKGLWAHLTADDSYRASVPAGHAVCGVALSYRVFAPDGK